jgi:hypothetical protein
MPSQARNILLKTFAFLLMGMVLIQGGCSIDKEDKKEDLSYISREDFMFKMEGDWYVNSFRREHPGYDYGVNIWFSKDSIKYTVYPADTAIIYSIDDPFLCTLDEIENIEYWTISENDNELILKTEDLCGDTNTFRIDFSNYEYYWYTTVFGFNARDFIMADVYLVGQYSFITLKSFRLYKEDYQGADNRIEFSVSGDGYQDYYYLHIP